MKSGFVNEMACIACESRLTVWRVRVANVISLVSHKEKERERVCSFYRASIVRLALVSLHELCMLARSELAKSLGAQWLERAEIPFSCCFYPFW